MTDASIAATKAVYKQGRGKDGWCCAYCHAAQFPGTRAGFVELLIHRLISHGKPPLLRNLNKRCHVTHSTGPAVQWSVTFSTNTGSTTWTRL